MAKDNPKKETPPADKPSSGGGRCKWFIIGTVLGLAVGTFAGWTSRPPDSFDAEELRAATERKFTQATDQSREKLADFAEDLARRLREEK